MTYREEDYGDGFPNYEDVKASLPGCRRTLIAVTLLIIFTVFILFLTI
jgi:hypothetical protein